MKQGKKITALALVLTMTLCAGACSCGSEGTTATNDEVATTVATVDEVKVTTTVVAETTAVQTEAKTEAITVPSETKAEEEKPQATKPQGNTSNNNNNKQDKPQSNTEAKYVPVNNIDLRQISLSLTAGESESIAVTVYPLNATDRSFTVKANNNNVSVSSSGNYVTITGKKVGSSKVTVSSSNGKYAVCEVTVKNKNTPAPAQITLDTPLTHDEMCNLQNMNKVCELINQYFIDLGMQYTPSFTKDTAGWFVSGTVYGSFPVSIRQYAQGNAEMFYRDFESCAYIDNMEFNQELIELTRFKCYTEYDSVQKEYIIYLCYG